MNHDPVRKRRRAAAKADEVYPEVTVGDEYPLPFVVANEIAIIDHLTQTAAERAMPEGLSLAGFSVLNHLVRRGDDHPAPAQIATAVHVTKGAVTGTLKRLEAAGWIIVDPDPHDGRGKIVRITEAGRAVRLQGIFGVAPLFADVFSQVEESEFEAILPTLQKIRRALEVLRG